MHCERLRQRGLKKPGGLLIASLAPGERRFQLITAGRARPAPLIGERLLRGQLNYGMKSAITQEIERERKSGLAGTIAERSIAGGAGGGEQTASHDADIKKIGERRARLKGKRARRRAPGAIAEISRGAAGGVEIAEVHERAGCVPGNFVGDRRIAALIGAVVARHSAGGFLNPGSREPAASLFKRRQFLIVLRGFRQPL